MRLQIMIAVLLSVLLSFTHNALATGDCDSNGTVTISEVQSSINMFLGLKTPALCVDEDNNGSVTIAEVQRTINTFLGLPTTKIATLKFSSQSTNSNELIGGFLLTVILPVGSVVPVDSSGVPLSSAVYLSGKFAGAFANTTTYDSVSRTLTVNYASTNEYNLGEFTTVIITVPISYALNASDILHTYAAWSPSGAGPSSSATATFTFN
jgi:hypothetical protein